MAAELCDWGVGMILTTVTERSVYLVSALSSVGMDSHIAKAFVSKFSCILPTPESTFQSIPSNSPLQASTTSYSESSSLFIRSPIYLDFYYILSLFNGRSSLQTVLQLFPASMASHGLNIVIWLLR